MWSLRTLVLSPTVPDQSAYSRWKDTEGMPASVRHGCLDTGHGIVPSHTHVSPPSGTSFIGFSNLSVVRIRQLGEKEDPGISK